MNGDTWADEADYLDSAGADRRERDQLDALRENMAAVWTWPQPPKHEPEFDAVTEDHGRRIVLTLDGRAHTMTTEHAGFMARCILDEIEGAQR